MGVLTSNNERSRYYGGFRGVDFSSDHTQVHDQRLAYLVNMYKDYQSGEGNALETVPGFRRRVVTPCGGEIFGVHEYFFRGDAGVEKRVLIHSGANLYEWHNYPASIGIPHQCTLTVPEGEDMPDIRSMKEYHISVDSADLVIKRVLSVTKQSGESILAFSYDEEKKTLIIQSSDLRTTELLRVTYYEGELQEGDALFKGMNLSKSSSFVFNNRLHLIDGKNFLVYDGKKVGNVLDNAYVPTTYIGIVPAGENADNGTEYEQRNILQPYFKHTFVADGDTKDFVMNETDLEEISEVCVYGKIISPEEYSVEKKGEIVTGKITFTEAPKKPVDADYPEFYAGVEITAKKRITKVHGVVEACEDVGALITRCTIATVFDNRVFLSGNPDVPNHVFFCGRNLTGYTDPTYFGVLNYFQDGVENSPITGLIPVADTLMVLKSDTQQDGMVFFHTPTETGTDVLPKIYPSKQGLHGVGCLGACINFLDDPIFVSRLGVEAIGQLSVRYERAVEHRSSLIDAKLAEMDLEKAMLEEWDGYLLLASEGKIFMADSRQKYQDELGVIQYEWYYLEDVGVYEGQYQEYVYADRMEPGLEGSFVEWTPPGSDGIVQIPLIVADCVHFDDVDEDRDLRRTTANPADIDGNETGQVYSQVLNVEKDAGEDGSLTYSANVYFTVHHNRKDGYRALLCKTYGAHIGGRFMPAKIVKSMDKNIFFGTAGGVVCSFNMDKREEGQIPTRYYTFDDRAIRSGCATKLDNCGIPHLNKTTVKKSTVIKTRSLQTTATKVKVRTNRQPFKQVARISSSVFTFDDLDFADFSFATEEQNLFGVKEKEKKWIEKQYYIYSDEYMRPFSLYYIAYRYRISGRYK